MRKLCARIGLFMAGAGVLLFVSAVARLYGAAAANDWHPVAVTYDLIGVTLTVVRGRLGVFW